MNNCFICDRIEDIKQQRNPNFVAELETGYIILLGNLRYPGYTIFSCKIHATELHELPHEFRMKYLEEMTFVAECIWHIYKPRKLNYELLGNSESHLHWHIIPRYLSEPKKYQKCPIWIVPERKRNKLANNKKLTILVNNFREKVRELQQKKIIKK